MQKYQFPKKRHYAGFSQIGSHIKYTNYIAIPYGLKIIILTHRYIYNLRSMINTLATLCALLRNPNKVVLPMHMNFQATLLQVLYFLVITLMGSQHDLHSCNDSVV